MALSPSLRGAIRRRLLAWYRAGHRDLPWRHTQDPYRIWLSETMLQQTRVETVVPYYEKFLARFPTLEALATADEDDVLREWAGLGYYARARNLKRAAAQVMDAHGGAVPRDAAQLTALPGVGRYTAGAIRSIAFREPAAIVDGNVERVVSRLRARPKLSRAELWRMAEELVPRHRPDQFNQALMELGARVCTLRSPSCSSCPLRTLCRGRDRPELYPARRARPRPREVTAIAGALTFRGRLLLLRRPARGLLGGLWETPSVAGGNTAELLRALRTRTGVRARTVSRLGTVRHLFSHRALTLEVVRLERVAGRLRSGSEARWCSTEQLTALPLSALMQKTLAVARPRLV